MRKDCEESVDQPNDVDCSKEDKPEVDEDVYLLIDDVEGENTESVMVLDGSRGSILTELTLGNFREHFVHWIDPSVQVLLWHSEHISPKLGELVTKEPASEVLEDLNKQKNNLHVGEVDLAEDVHQVEKLTENEFHKISSASWWTRMMI